MQEKKEHLYSSAIVSINNDPSKGLMDKLGFKMISKWTYISIKPIVFPDLDNAIADNSKVAKLSEYQQILNFLNQPDIFKLSRKKFVNSWRWHDLTEDRLKKMINNKQVIIFDNKYHNNNKDNDDDDKKGDKIRGIAIIDKEGYWNNPNIFQIIYIDAYSDEILLSLVIKCLELISSKENKYERVQIFTPFPIKDNSLLFQKFDINFSEQFLLYHKEI